MLLLLLLMLLLNYGIWSTPFSLFTSIYYLKIHVHRCYLLARRSELGKTVPKLLRTLLSLWPWVVVKTKLMVFPNTDWQITSGFVHFLRPKIQGLFEDFPGPYLTLLSRVFKTRTNPGCNMYFILYGTALKQTLCWILIKDIQFKPWACIHLAFGAKKKVMWFVKCLCFTLFYGATKSLKGHQRLKSWRDPYTGSEWENLHWKLDLPLDSWPTLLILMRHTFSGFLSLTQVETVEFASKSQENEHHCHGQQDTWHNEMLTVQGLCMYNVNEKKVMA